MSAPQPISEELFIGKFRVLRVLGRGSEGVVYLASDTKLDPEVAIKTSTLGQTADPVLADLLVSTAQTASRLSHPNIVPVFEAGMHEGAPYVVFEYVEGRSLAQMIAAGSTNKEIADKLYWSEVTVKRKTQDIFEKLDVANRAQAVAEATRRGLL